MTDIYPFSPVNTLLKIGKSVFKSSSFLSTLITSYMSMICLQRRLISNGVIAKDHKFVYYLFGLLSASSIFLEAKSRRRDLALYVLPKGIHALYLVLLNRKWIIRIPGFDVFIASVGMGILMGYLQTCPQKLTPLVKKLLTVFVGEF
jgi:hypothetical protein